MDVQVILNEFRTSGLALESLTGNSAKLRLSLDLAALLSEDPPLEVLDVGCAGPVPLNLWEPFLPLAGRLRVVGVDVANLGRAEARARELDFAMEFREASALALTETFGTAVFDAVVSTQVLEHLRDWPRALREMWGVLRPGGTLFLTCDSGDVRSALSRRARLAGKRAYARVRQRYPSLGRLTDRALSGEWERGPTRAELRETVQELGLEVERLEHYCLSDVKTAQRYAGPATRQLWLAFEEALAAETSAPLDSGLYGVLYLRARRPPADRASA